MTMTTQASSIPWRWLGWGGAAMLLATPAIAMRFSSEVDWTAFDFVVFAIMLLAAGGMIEMFVRQGSGLAYHLAAGVTGAAAFLLVWINLAVGIIGSEDDPANFMYVAIFATLCVGTIAARFRAAGMMRTLLFASVIQAGIGFVAVAAGWGRYAEIWPRDIIGASVLFCLMWLLAAALFYAAAAHARDPA